MYPITGFPSNKPKGDLRRIPPKGYGSYAIRLIGSVPLKADSSRERCELFPKVMTAVICTCCFIGAHAQERTEFQGVTANHYEVDKNISCYIETGSYQGAHAIIVPASFELHESATRGWMMAAATGGHSEIIDKAKARFGKLYITQDRVVFEPEEGNSSEHFTWSLARTEIHATKDKIGSIEIKNQPGVWGYLHFTGFNDKKNGERYTNKPEEGLAAFAKSKPKPPTAAFLNDFDHSLSSFDDEYTQLAQQSGAE